MLGARGTGKTSFIKELLPPSAKVHWVNLLDDALYQEYLVRPARFVEDIPKNFNQSCWVVADEIQRLPKLLNYVHLLIEERKIKFALTGSSARKLKRGGANLLAGRAFMNALYPLTHLELKDDFILDDVLNWGSLPKIFDLKTSVERSEFLKAYVSTYLRQEIKEEQVVRQLDPFVRFLEIAAQHNGKIVNAAKIGRDAGVDDKAVLRYFEILSDTLVGFYLDPFHRSARKIQTSKSKFYFFDLGVKRALEGTLSSPLISSTGAFGEAFEHFFILECIRLNEYYRKNFKFYYLRTKDDVEIDLIIEKSKKELWAIEIKSALRVDEKEIGKIKKLAADLEIKRLIVASREKSTRTLEKNIEIMNWRSALNEIFK
jgi:predicted AAA+ superfamily ATPase